MVIFLSVLCRTDERRGAESTHSLLFMKTLVYNDELCAEYSRDVLTFVALLARTASVSQPTGM